MYESETFHICRNMWNLYGSYMYAHMKHTRRLIYEIYVSYKSEYKNRICAYSKLI